MTTPLLGTEPLLAAQTAPSSRAPFIKVGEIRLASPPMLRVVKTCSQYYCALLAPTMEELRHIGRKCSSELTSAAGSRALNTLRSGAHIARCGGVKVEVRTRAAGSFPSCRRR